MLRVGDLEDVSFFESAILNFFCYIPMKISPNLHGRMDGSKFRCFPWFPKNSLLCIISRYTVYVVYLVNNSNKDIEVNEI